MHPTFSAASRLQRRVSLDVDRRKSDRSRTFGCGDDVEILCGCVFGRFRRGGRDVGEVVRLFEISGGRKIWKK